MSNSQLIVFYSENRYVTVNGTITNWNSTGLEQNYSPSCKYTLQCLTKILKMSPGQCNKKRSHFFLYKR